MPNKKEGPFRKWIKNKTESRNKIRDSVLDKSRRSFVKPDKSPNWALSLYGC